MSSNSLARWAPDVVFGDDPWQGCAFTPWPNNYSDPYMSADLAESIVENDHAAWSLLEKSRSARNCRQRYSYGRRGAVPVTLQHPCDVWSCEQCAIQKVVVHLGNLHRVFSYLEGVFVMRLPAGFNLQTLNQQLRRGHARPNTVEEAADPSGIWRVTIKRDDGEVWCFATGEPAGGAAAFGEWMDPIDAFKFAQHALRLPGISHAPTYSRHGGPAERGTTGTPLVAYKRGMKRARKDALHRVLEVKANQQHQRSFDELTPTEMDRLGFGVVEELGW